MYSIQIPDAADWTEAQQRLHPLLHAGIKPDELSWDSPSDQLSLFCEETPPLYGSNLPTFSWAEPVEELAEAVSCHRSKERWNYLYTFLWKIRHENRNLWQIASDPAVRPLRLMERAVNHATHHFHAFVRFKKIQNNSESQYVAWFEPPHRVLRRGIRFFVNRFPNDSWSILTPDECAHWDGKQLSFTSGVQPPNCIDDPIETLWKKYFTHINNPARSNPKLQQRSMPRHYWKNLPEMKK